MSFIPSAVLPLVLEFQKVFSQPTFRRWSVLMLGIILTSGRRTVLNILRTIGGLAPGHPSSYNRVWSLRRWSLWKVGRILAGLVLQHLVKEETVFLVGDDTVEEHRGKKVYGKGLHRDAVRSSQSYKAFRWGHKWIVLAILVRFPFTNRPWALPVLVALYRPPKISEQEGRRHKTPPVLMRQLLAVLMRWFPERKWVFSGDGGFSTHELASFACRHQSRLNLVGRFYPKASLHEPPPPPKKNRKVGRPRIKGKKLPSPEKVVEKSRLREENVSWYGGGRRNVGLVSGCGHWYKIGKGLVPLRWVFVKDRTGTHRDDYFFSTDPEMDPVKIIEIFTGRWSIEVTFEEIRAHLGFESTRGWSKKTVLRAAPCIFGLFSFVALFYSRLPRRVVGRPVVQWQGKTHVTFSDAITVVRRALWEQWIYKHPMIRRTYSKIPPHLRETLLFALAPAA